MRATKRPPRSRQREAGFSIIELVVALLISVEILIGAAIAFDVHNRIAHVQLQVTDMQQSQRIAQYDLVRAVRTAGRGGLPLDLRPDAVFNASPPAQQSVELQGLAIEVRNNVSGNDTYIARGDNTSPQALSGTDILTVRGCISTQLFQADLNSLQPTANDATDHARTLTLYQHDNAVETEVHQDLVSLRSELQNYVAGSNYYGQMIIVGTQGRTVYGVGTITGYSDADYPNSLALTLSTTNTDATSSNPLSPINPLDPGATLQGQRSFPDNMTSVLACYLEEYRYYIRQEYEIPGNSASGLHPRLSRARFEPGTEQPYLADTQNFKLDLADELIDLQVALGLDTDYCEGCSIGTSPGAFDDDDNVDGPDDVLWEDTTTGGAPEHDDWLYNSSRDDPMDTLYVTHGGTFQPGNAVKLYFVRVTTVARTAKGDPDYAAPNFSNALDSGTDAIEDHDYNSGFFTLFKSEINRKHRHRVLTTLIAPRNVS